MEYQNDAEALAADFVSLLAEGFILPFQVATMDSQGNINAGSYKMEPGSHTTESVLTFQETVSRGDQRMHVPYYMLIIDAVGQAAVRKVVYRGQDSDAVIAQGPVTGRLGSSLHRVL
jgi:hypothetical protein